MINDLRMVKMVKMVNGKNARKTEKLNISIHIMCFLCAMLLDLCYLFWRFIGALLCCRCGHSLYLYLGTFYSDFSFAPSFRCSFVKFFRYFPKLAGVTVYINLALSYAYHEILHIHCNNRYYLDKP